MQLSLTHPGPFLYFLCSHREPLLVPGCILLLGSSPNTLCSSNHRPKADFMFLMWETLGTPNIPFKKSSIYWVPNQLVLT